MLREFRNFILRGNAIDLAVAVVIGAAFGAVVTSLVEDIVTPIISIIFGKPGFEDLTITINDAVIRYGSFLNAVLSLLTIGAAVFFFVVKPVNALMARHATEPDVERETRECPACLSNIPVGARRCAFCTEELSAAA